MHVVLTEQQLYKPFIKMWAEFYKKRSLMYLADAKYHVKNGDNAYSAACVKQAALSMKNAIKLDKLDFLLSHTNFETLAATSEQELEWFTSRPPEDTREEQPIY